MSNIFNLTCVRRLKGWSLQMELDIFIAYIDLHMVQFEKENKNLFHTHSVDTM